LIVDSEGKELPKDMADTYQRITHQPTSIETDSEYEREDTIISVRDDNPGITKAQYIVQYAVGIVSGLLLIRFLLALFGANANNLFVDFIYTITNPIVSPFTGLFALDTNSGVARFEIETLIATIVYILIGLVVMRLLDVFRRT
jgi:uncharacterized protein YggT (Ycf19 family)